MNRPSKVIVISKGGSRNAAWRCIKDHPAARQICRRRPYTIRSQTPRAKGDIFLATNRQEGIKIITLSLRSPYTRWAAQESRPTQSFFWSIRRKSTYYREPRGSAHLCAGLAPRVLISDQEIRQDHMAHLPPEIPRRAEFEPAPDPCFSPIRLIEREVFRPGVFDDERSIGQTIKLSQAERKLMTISSRVPSSI
ncbi:hypothetical protein DL93DRAFT_494821 [Clavulina sp. PMI_390]|nr:hypothetical protein DL93DRAFT_494821 [Clavulina sp. PMI_390]